jgi:hypothetical protein
VWGISVLQHGLADLFHASHGLVPRVIQPCCATAVVALPGRVLRSQWPCAAVIVALGHSHGYPRSQSRFLWYGSPAARLRLWRTLQIAEPPNVQHTHTPKQADRRAVGHKWGMLRSMGLPRAAAEKRCKAGLVISWSSHAQCCPLIEYSLPVKWTFLQWNTCLQCMRCVWP